MITVILICVVFLVYKRLKKDYAERRAEREAQKDANMSAGEVAKWMKEEMRRKYPDWDGTEEDATGDDETSRTRR
jgi:choline-glycine betaine transporter